MVGAPGCGSTAVVSCSTDSLNQPLRRGFSWIEYNVGAVRHQVNVCRLHPSGLSESTLHVMLAGSTRHTDHRQG